jgi:hypothetical protein
MKPVQHDKTIVARLPAPLAKATIDAARARFMSSAAFVRQAVAEKLEREGFAVDTVIDRPKA